MSLLYSLEIGSSYDIPMLATAILGTKYSNATIMGLLDFDSAIQISDVTAIHASILSLLPTGTPTDASKLIYVKIKTSTGAVVVLALNWISKQPTLINTTTLTVVITNVNRSQAPALAAVLTANGFTSFSIT